ncbi:MAG: hypothetical protein HGA85_04020 [Nanoarchaeota archaeon]|nr:hypothetical protein [Nanoarchaeota archaeon]
MPFDHDKKMCLEKLATIDKSRKGDVDEAILPLVKTINSTRDFYTTSSCAGRIQVLTDSEGKKKNEVAWLFSSHDMVDVKVLKEALVSLPEETVWFRVEAPIIHLAARDLDGASRMLKLANEAGIRRTAIISFGKKVILELMVPEKMDTLLAKDGKLLVDDNYLAELVSAANNKLERSRKGIKKLKLLLQKDSY